MQLVSILKIRRRKGITLLGVKLGKKVSSPPVKVQMGERVGKSKKSVLGGQTKRSTVTFFSKRFRAVCLKNSF